MISLDELRDKMKHYNLTAVAKASGVSYRTVISIANGENKNPSYESVRALAKFFEIEVSKHASK